MKFEITPDAPLFSWDGMATAFFLLVCVFFSGLFGWMLRGDITGSYEKGQIDALTGKAQWELRQNERGETVWTEKKP